MRDWHKMLVALAIGWMLTSSLAFAQQQPKLRPLRIALPSNSRRYSFLCRQESGNF